MYKSSFWTGAFLGDFSTFEEFPYVIDASPAYYSLFGSVIFASSYSNMIHYGFD